MSGRKFMEVHGTDVEMKGKVGWKNQTKQRTAIKSESFRPDINGRKKKI